MQNEFDFDEMIESENEAAETQAFMEWLHTMGDKFRNEPQMKMMNLQKVESVDKLVKIVKNYANRVNNNPLSEKVDVKSIVNVEGTLEIVLVSTEFFGIQELVKSISQYSDAISIETANDERIRFGISVFDYYINL